MSEFVAHSGYLGLSPSLYKLGFHGLTRHQTLKPVFWESDNQKALGSAVVAGVRLILRNLELRIECSF